MSEKVMEAARLMNSLPEEEQNLAFELIRRLVLAWDPDFTKVTVEERAKIEEAENSGFLDESEIDWENIGK